MKFNIFNWKWDALLLPLNKLYFSGMAPKMVMVIITHLLFQESNKNVTAIITQVLSF